MAVVSRNPAKPRLQLVDVGYPGSSPEDPLNLTIAAGQRVGLVVANKQERAQLLRLLLGWSAPQQGLRQLQGSLVGAPCGWSRPDPAWRLGKNLRLAASLLGYPSDLWAEVVKKLPKDRTLPVHYEQLPSSDLSTDLAIWLESLYLLELEADIYVLEAGRFPSGLIAQLTPRLETLQQQGSAVVVLARNLQGWQGLLTQSYRLQHGQLEPLAASSWGDSKLLHQLQKLASVVGEAVGDKSPRLRASEGVLWLGAVGLDALEVAGYPTHFRVLQRHQKIRVLGLYSNLEAACQRLLVECLRPPAPQVDRRLGWEWAGLRPFRQELESAHGLRLLSDVEEACSGKSGSWMDSPWLGTYHGGRLRFARQLRWHLSTRRPLCCGLIAFTTEQQKPLSRKSGVPTCVHPLPVPAPSKTFDLSQRGRALLGWWPESRGAHLLLHHAFPGYRKLLFVPSELLGRTAPAGCSRTVCWENESRYNDMLSRQVAFLHYQSFGGDRALVDCLVRGTPVLVNRLAGVVEYLGEDYPLYYENLGQARDWLQDEARLEAAHHYLRGLPVGHYLAENFYSQVLQSPLRDQLLKPPGPDVLLFAHARSGSTALQKVLETQWRMLGEPFHPGKWRNNVRSYGDEASDENGLKSCLARFRKRYHGLRHLWTQLPRELNEVLVQQFPKVIFLRRKNLLQSAVSLEISRHLREWGDSVRNSVLEKGLPPLSVDRLQARIERMRSDISFYQQSFQASGRDVLELLYEDLFHPSEPGPRTLEPLWNYLGYSPDPAAQQHIAEWMAPENKSNDRLTYQKIPNVEEIEARLSGPENGSLFSPDVPR